jgi:hypothetical protein
MLTTGRRNGFSHGGGRGIEMEISVLSQVSPIIDQRGWGLTHFARSLKRIY